MHKYGRRDCHLSAPNASSIMALKARLECAENAMKLLQTALSARIIPFARSATRLKSILCGMNALTVRKCSHIVKSVVPANPALSVLTREVSMLIMSAKIVPFLSQIANSVKINQPVISANLITSSTKNINVPAVCRSHNIAMSALNKIVQHADQVSPFPKEENAFCAPTLAWHV